MRFYKILQAKLVPSLIYSFMLYRQNNNQAATIDDMISILHLTKKKIKDCILKLHKLKLVNFEDNNLHAIQPLPNLFNFRNDGKGALYWEVSLKSVGTIRDTILLGILKSLYSRGQAKQSFKGLANLMGLDRTTCARCCARLKEKNLLQYSATKNGIVIEHIGNQQADIKPSKAKVEITELPNQGLSEKPREFQWTDYSMWRPPLKLLQREGVSDNLLNELCDTAIDLCLNSDYNYDGKWLGNLILNMQRQHAKTGQAASCYNLVKHKLKEIQSNPELGQTIKRGSYE